ncbi:MAG: NAD-dependent epimerase/dehydratase family protein [Myxococcales bacterium]|nr:NAD-dependent epimerase/dehydratase family protein [Myxococcota bacterium]MDW8282419.1 NAD-dependent epimerase/dehydratase family protein [Myxococcales bacterium]
MGTHEQKSPYVILGCGYVGTRLAQSLLRDGHFVRACARRVALLEPLQRLGADIHYLDASRPRQFISALRALPQPAPVVVYSIPGVPELPAGEAVRRAANAALQANARAFIYLGTTGVYGFDQTDNERWVDEDTPVDLHDPEMTSRLTDEAVLATVKMAGLRTIVLRLSAIYGPPLWPGQSGRGVRQRLRRGDYRLWDGGHYYFSRIHVDDLVAIIRAAALRAPAGAVYVVGDDHPCPQAEYARWLASHLGLPEPPTASSLSPEAPRQYIRGRRIRNERMKRELGIKLLYPSYREGELQIDAAEAGLAAPPSAPGEAPAAAAEQTPGRDGPPPPTTLPAGPRPLAPGDLGEQLGLPEIGAVARELAPGERTETSWVHLVLSGHVEAQWQGQLTPVPSLSLVPPGVELYNPGPDRALLLVFHAAVR